MKIERGGWEAQRVSMSGGFLRMVCVFRVPFFSIVQTYITLTLDSTIFYLVNIKLSSLIVIPLTIDIVICIAIICVNNHIVHQEVHSSLSLRSVFIGNPVITVESFSFLLFFFTFFFLVPLKTTFVRRNLPFRYPFLPARLSFSLFRSASSSRSVSRTHSHSHTYTLYSSRQ